MQAAQVWRERPLKLGCASDDSMAGSQRLGDAGGAGAGGYGLIDAAVGGLVARPFPWVALIAGTLPLSMIVFVAMPLLKNEGRDSETGARGRD